MKRRRLAAIAFMAMVLVSAVLVACDVYMDGGTAVQEVFENDLIEDGVYLADGSAILTIKPAVGVPEEIDHYEVRVYRHGESKAVFVLNVPYEDKDVEVALSLQRGLYDIEVVGIHQKADSSFIVVCKGSFEGYRLTKACEGVAVQLSDVGHIMVHYERVAPTCEQDGNIEYWYCKRCERSFQDEEGTTLIVGSIVLGKLHPQSLVKVEAVDATCTHEGNIEYWKCPVCGNWYRDGLGEILIEDKADVVVAKLPHNPDSAWHHDSACPDSHWHECTVCGLKIDAEPHSWDDGVVTKDPTETEQGERTYTCTVCAATRVEPIDPTGEHEWETVAFESKDPTCTEDGYYKYKCKDCGAEKTDVLKALGHDVEPFDFVPAGCETAGHKAYWQCNRCGKYFSDAELVNETTWNEIELPANGHRSETWCDDGETGSGHWKVCTVCGKMFDSGKHALVENAEEKYLKSPATCESPAVYYKSCETCGWKSGETFTHGTVTGHEPVEVAYKPSTCTEEGVRHHWHCNNCGGNFEDAACTKKIDDVSIDMVPHTFDYEGKSYQIDAENGLHSVKCKVCGTPDVNNWTKHSSTNPTSYGHNGTCHWEICVCGYHLTKDENHIWNLVGGKNVCSVCGRTADDDKTESSGFDVDVSNPEPQGRLELEQKGNVWTFTFEDEKVGTTAEVKRIEWYVNGVKQSETSNEFTLMYPERRSYTVMCIFFNSKSAASRDVTITGTGERK